MGVLRATAEYIAPILAASPEVNFDELRGNIDMLPPTSERAEKLRRLLDDEWHAILVLEEAGQFAGWLFLVYQRERMIPGDPFPLGDHIRIRHVKAEHVGPLFEHAVALAREKGLTKLDLDYDAPVAHLAALREAARGMTTYVRRRKI